MGKKNKSFKEKLYSIPRCKILVVLHPWGSHGHPTFANNIGGWFERMLQDDYPGKSINMIFTRPSDTVTLVEFPEDVDVAPLLGAHHHCNFLIPPYNASDAISYVYEYNYIKKGPPERQSCWKPGFHSYQSLQNGFPVKFPYPAPSPAPNPPDSLGNLAQALPPHLLKRPDDLPPIVGYLSRDVLATSISTPGASSSRLPNLIPSPEHVRKPETQNMLYTSPSYPPKAHDHQQNPVEIKQEERTFVQKSDPYDDEDAATSLLQTRDDSKPVKNEPSVDHAEAFLHSILSVKKEEPVSHRVPLSPPAPTVDTKFNVKRDDGYEPSTDLLEYLATLPPDFVSGVPTHVGIPGSVKVEDNAVDEYRPSDELLSTFATLLENEANQDVKLTIKTEEPQPPVVFKVKAEPTDDDTQLGWAREPTLAEITRSTTLATDDGTAEPRSRSSPPIRVKAEPQENCNLFMPPPTRDPRKRPQPTLSMYKEEYPSVHSPKTQDPRARPATSQKLKREAESADGLPAHRLGGIKRIKREWD